jgi:hypothetical protein
MTAIRYSAELVHSTRDGDLRLGQTRAAVRSISGDRLFTVLLGSACLQACAHAAEPRAV